jgi:tetratricopeptide (TPR) repeat protein
VLGWRVRRRLALARYWQTAGDLDQAAGDAYRAHGLLHRRAAAPAGLAAEISLTLAAIERDRDRADRSREHLQDALARLEPVPPAAGRDRLLARTLIALGDGHRRAGRYREAGATLDRALGLLDPPPGQPAVEPGLLAAALTIDGITAKELGEYDRAAGCYARVAQLLGAATGPDAAGLQHNLAGLAYARGRYAEAETHARSAVALRQQARAGAVDLAADRAVLGSAVAKQGRLAEAAALFEQALAACRAARPPRRYEIAVQLHNLADIDHDAGRPADAERRYLEALALKEELLGADHPETAVLANNLGSLLRDQQRTAAARGWYERALAVATRAYPATHPVTVRIRHNLDQLAAAEDRQDGR